MPPSVFDIERLENCRFLLCQHEYTIQSQSKKKRIILSSEKKMNNIQNK